MESRDDGDGQVIVQHYKKGQSSRLIEAQTPQDILAVDLILTRASLHPQDCSEPFIRRESRTCGAARAGTFSRAHWYGTRCEVARSPRWRSLDLHEVRGGLHNLHSLSRV